MGYISTLLGLDTKAAFPGPPTDDFWYKTLPGRGTFDHKFSTSSPDAAMAVSAFFAGVRLLSESVAQPPLLVYEKTSDNSKERATGTVLYDLLKNAPNSYQSSYEWRIKVMMDLLLRGNSYNLLESGARGAVTAILPLDAQHMRVILLANNRPGYVYRDSKGIEHHFIADEILHFKAFPLALDGLTGLSVLAFARNAVGLSLTREAFGAKLFEEGAFTKAYLAFRWH